MTTSITQQLRGLGFTQKQIKRTNNILRYRGFPFNELSRVAIVNCHLLRAYSKTGYYSDILEVELLYCMGIKL